MAQQVFTQWVPVAKAQNEQGQEVYLPFAGIHAQTRDGKDELIVGAGNMVWTGSMWVPVSTQNRLPVDTVVSGTVDVSDRADRQLGQVALSGRIAERLYFAENVTVTAGSDLVLLPRSERLEFRKIAVGFYFYQQVSSEQQYRALVRHLVAVVPTANSVQVVAEAIQRGAGIVELEGYVYEVVLRNQSTQDQTARAISVWGVR